MLKPGYLISRRDKQGRTANYFHTARTMRYVTVPAVPTGVTETQQGIEKATDADAAK